MAEKIKYLSYEAILIHERGNRTSISADFYFELMDRFKNHPTAVKMIVLKATHNKTRIKYFRTIEK